MKKKTIAVLGMSCAGCAANVEKKLKSLNGINSAAVNFASRTALVEYDGSVITPQNMKDEVIKIGYDLVIEEDRSVTEIEHHAYKRLLQQVVTSWIIAITVMAITMDFIHIDYANQVAMILAAANMIYCGRNFYVVATKQLCHGSANMDTLVALSTGIAFLFSLFNTFWSDFWTSRGVMPHVYYDASVMIITFVLTGRLMEERAKNGTASAIRSLMGLVPKSAHLVSGTEVTEVPISTLRPDDIIKVRPGEKIPVDGNVTDGNPHIDESMISGEPVPVGKNTGDKVLAGTICKDGVFSFRATDVGSGTMLAHIIQMVQEAQGSKAPVQRIVDKIALIFVPTVVALSIITFLIWIIVGGMDNFAFALLSGVSVLVIACPCALGLATPTALMVGIGKAAESNILIKDATALENIRGINAMVIDKTGTLTEPKDVDWNNTDLKFEDKEKLKPNAREAISELHKNGIEVYMTSGDNKEAVEYWAGKAGITHYFSKVLPQDKEDLVRKMQNEGYRVAMVGDGINDSQALAAAAVSIAMGKGTDVAIDAAQVTLMTTDLMKLPEAISLSRRTVRMIHENLFWAFIYNMIGIPIAAGALYPICGLLLNPMWASAAMAFSSVSVVLNSLRLKLKA